MPSSIVIVGAGPNLGAAVARRFGREGFAVDRGIHVGHTAIPGRIASGGDHEPDDITDVLWRHHAGRADFQVRVGID